MVAGPTLAVSGDGQREDMNKTISDLFLPKLGFYQSSARDQNYATRAPFQFATPFVTPHDTITHLHPQGKTPKTVQVSPPHFIDNKDTRIKEGTQTDARMHAT